MRCFAFVLATVCAVAALPAAAVEVQVSAPSDLRGELRAASLTITTADQDGVTAQEVLSAARADYARLLGVLYAGGYYSPRISIKLDGREAADIAPFSIPKTIRNVVIAVEPGAPFTFGTARVAPLAPDTAMPPEFTAGQPAKSTAISAAARAGIDGWRDQGHAKADVQSQSITANHAAQVLDADIRLAPGPLLTFGDLNIVSDTRVRSKRVREIAGLKKGEVFSPTALNDASQRLRFTGVFRSVTLREAEEPNPDGSLDIEARLIDEKRRRYGFGAEFSTFDGLGFSAFWLHRNLRDRAERLQIEAEIGGISGQTTGLDYSLGATITRPSTFRADTDLVLSALYENRDDPEYIGQIAHLEARLNRRINEELTFGYGVALNYSDIRDDLGRRSFTHILFPVSGTLDRRDSELNPTTGLFTDLTVEPFMGLSQSSSGIRTTADARIYRGFGADDRVVLAGRLQLGSVLGPRAAEVPPDMLFFSGGGGTVRGQDFQSLGVTRNGVTLGGRSFLGLSGEVRFGLTPKIGLVGFADAGFIGADAIPGQNGQWHSGAGFGLRYDAGIGPIRFDLAVPTDGSGDGVQAYIGIGQAF